VPRVWSLIENLQTPLLDSSGNAADIGSIGAEVNEDVGTGSQSVEYDGWEITSNLLSLVAAIAEADEVAAPLKFMSAGIDVATRLNPNPEGSNAQDDVRTTAADLGVSERAARRSRLRAAKPPLGPAPGRFLPMPSWRREG
jgi:hypothetical protein